MTREKKPRQRAHRYGEKPQWRERWRTWVARVWEPETGWSPRIDLGNNREVATERYEHWVETGQVPLMGGKETFEQAAVRVVDEAEACGEIEPELAAERRQRLRDYAIPRIGQLKVGKVSPSQVATVLDAMAKKDDKSAGTILKMRSDISQVLSKLVREGAIDINTARHVALPKQARTDARERMMLTDAQVLEFQKKRGFDTELDMMALFSREIGGHRTSDEHAGVWQDVDLERFAWMKVRRPKTDGASGARAKVGQRRTRAYELVTHETDQRHRRPLRAYWERMGKPTSGPIFPLRRSSSGGPVKDAEGKVLYVRKGSEKGGHKGKGSSYAAALRRAVWAAGIYVPMPVGTKIDGVPTKKAFDPKAPDPGLCRLQTDTDETRRLDFQSFRRGLVTALADAKVSEHDQLAITGHTQLTTQLRHYMGKRRVKVPAAALPGGAVEEGAPAVSAEILAAIETIQRAGLGAKTPEKTAVLPPVGSKTKLKVTSTLPN